MKRWTLVFLLLFLTTCSANSFDNKQKDKIFFENLEVYRLLTLLEPRNLLKNGVYEFAEDGARESDTCTEALIKIQEAISSNFTQEMWAYEMLDASSKIPSGLLEGNIIDLGMFDECIAIENETLAIRGQHCMYGVELSDLSSSVEGEGKLSICLPSSCSENDISAFLNATINSIAESYNLTIGFVSVSCSPLDRQIWDTEFTICFSILVIFIGFLVTCTVIEIIMDRRDEYQKTKTMTTLAQFSFKKNAAAIFNMELSKGNLPVLHGLRFISMAWIVLGHECMYMFEFPAVNMFYTMLEWPFQWNALYIFTAQYSVDTFFAISGFLLSYVFLKQTSKQRPFNLPKYYIHRIIRLTPAVIALYFCFIVFVPKVGSGPLWHDTIDANTEKCREKWWPTFVYLQNFVYQDQCLGHLWYLAVDMQLFWISPIILYPLYRKPKIGLIILAAFFLASMITPAVIIIVNEYNVASYVHTRNGDISWTKEMFNNVYIVPYTRAAPWLLGILLGYEVVKKNRKPTKFVISIGWFLALGSLAFCILFTKYFTEPDYQLNIPLEAFFITSSRAMWGFGICWIIYASIHNCGGVITKFLSIRIFLPLSRISYCIYLVHMLVESMQAAGLRTVRYFTDYYAWYYWIPDFVIAIVVATFFSLLFESPILVLEKMIFNRKRKSPSESQKELASSSNKEKC